MKPVEQEALRSPSVLALLAANLFPLYGVLAHGWSVFPVVFLFWMENVVVGVYNVLRLLLARTAGGAAAAEKRAAIPFFIAHYGLFTMGHGAFVIALFGQELGGFSGARVPDPRPFLWIIERYGLIVPALALVISHGVSFGWNFIHRGEREHATVRQLMFRPYGRVVVLHITLVFGGFLVMGLHSPTSGLLLLLLLKVALDLRAHRKERAKLAGANVPSKAKQAPRLP